MLKIEDLKVGDIIYHENNVGVLYTIKYITKESVLVSFSMLGKVTESLISKDILNYYRLSNTENFSLVYIVTFRTKFGEIDTIKLHYYSEVDMFRKSNNVLDVSEYVEFKMIKIEDLKVGDVLIGNYTGQEYKIVYISENNNIFAEYDVSNKVVPTHICRNRLDNYTLKPRHQEEQRRQTTDQQPVIPTPKPPPPQMNL